MVRFLELLLLCSLLKDQKYIAFARQMPSGRVFASNTFAAFLSNQTQISFSASASVSISNDHTYTLDATTGLPAQSINPGTCSFKDLYCSSKTKNETIPKANATSVDDPCLLWDPSCSGNRTWAIDTFFDPTFQRDLLRNRCFVDAGSVNLGNESDCDKYNPSRRISEFQEMKNWMRSKQCASAATDWAAVYESAFDPDSHMAVVMDPYQYHVVDGANPSCCGRCSTNVQNVDIYYWPEPDVNTSCLSIIGNSVKPIDSGATKSVVTVGTITATDTYWACEPKVSTYFDTFRSESVTDTEPIRTAVIRTIGSLLVKVYISDLWSPSPCTSTESDISSSGPNTIAMIRDRHATMRARGHTLIVAPSGTHSGSLPVTTMVSGNFTL